MTQQEIQQRIDAMFAALPPEKQEELRAQYSSASDGLRTYGGSLESQTQQLEEQRLALEGWRTKLRTWAVGKESELTQREAALASRENGGGRPAPTPNPQNPPPPTPNPEQPDVVTTDRLRETLNVFGRDVFGAAGQLFKLAQRHSQLYGNEREFDPDELYRHPRILEGLEVVFNDLHKERIAQRAQEAAAKREAELRADERQKVIAEFGTNKTVPFPVPGEDDSPLAIRERALKSGQQEEYGVDAAVAYHRQLVAERAARPV